MIPQQPGCRACVYKHRRRRTDPGKGIRRNRIERNGKRSPANRRHFRLADLGRSPACILAGVGGSHAFIRFILNACQKHKETGERKDHALGMVFLLEAVYSFSVVLRKGREVFL